MRDELDQNDLDEEEVELPEGMHLVGADETDDEDDDEEEKKGDLDEDLEDIEEADVETVIPPPGDDEPIKTRLEELEEAEKELEKELDDLSADFGAEEDEEY